VTSKKPTTCTHPSDAISHSLIHHRSYRVNSDIAVTLWCVSECVCVHDLNETSRTTNTKLGTRILYGRALACTDPEVKRSKVKGQGHAVIKCATDAGMQVDMTASVSR